MSLKLENVTCAIADTTIVSGISLDIAPGKILGLIGSNGVGKTTVLRVCAGLLAPRDGSVTLDNVPLSNHLAAERSRTIAYLPQDNRIHWPVNVRTIVELGRLPHASAPGNSAAHDTVAVDAALEQLELSTLADRPVTKLSGGERRRVLIARALAQQPQYLLADEPTTGLDPGHRLDLFHQLKTIAKNENVGVLVVLHDLSAAARHCDQLMLLADGGVLAKGKPQDVLTEQNLATAYGVSSQVDFSGNIPVVSLLDTLAASSSQ